MHPDPMGYDEELQRVVDTATMVKNVLPDVQVAAPSTCAWWFCKLISLVEVLSRHSSLRMCVHRATD